DLHDAVPLGDGELVDRDAVRHRVDSGVVDEDVEPAEVADDFGEDGVDLRGVADVEGQRPGARGAGGGLSRAWGVDVGVEDAGAVGGEGVGDGLADAAGGAGHQRHLMGEVDFHYRLLRHCSLAAAYPRCANQSDSTCKPVQKTATRIKKTLPRPR